MIASRNKLNTIALLFVTISLVSANADAMEKVAWDSWQLRNPAMAGVMSAATLGVWPKKFGDDLERVDLNAFYAIGDGSLPYVLRHAETAFRVWRGIGFAVLGLICLFFAKRLLLRCWRSLAVRCFDH
jgi:hypothetical protein